MKKTQNLDAQSTRDKLIALHQIMDDWELSCDDAAQLVGLPVDVIKQLPTTMPQEGIGPMAAERIDVLTQVEYMLNMCFSLKERSLWLHSKHKFLYDRSPLAYMLAHPFPMEAAWRVRKYLEHLAYRGFM